MSSYRKGKRTPDKGQKTFSACLFDERIVMRRWQDGGEIQLREYVTADRRRCWQVVYVDDQGSRHRGHAFSWKYAKRAFNEAGKEAWA